MKQQETLISLFDKAWNENQIHKTKLQHEKIKDFLYMCDKHLSSKKIEKWHTLNGLPCYYVISYKNSRVVFFHANSSSWDSIGHTPKKGHGLHFIQSKGFKPHGLRLITRNWIVEHVWEDWND